ncbi:hypothetical protein EOS_19910 [Caballeronia mineralivorans PML1(12)]|uniref:Uncharacterized protein n=1 Tax=Caballeronia mineralivorans PML1(12) TaxID=908627 RepID=A0A0J1CV05_9BURK|nr:hypothetical protein EOS_19910 [Caballeronia mineralivorans PML1(12)]
MDAVVESMTFIYGEPEGFAIVVARVEAMHGHEGVLTAEPLSVDPNLRNAPILVIARSAAPISRRVE